MLKWPNVVLAVVASALLAIRAPARAAADPLEQGFRTPPDSAKPRTWWHWTGSNITKAGITKDLEWMKHAGIGGMQLADVSVGGGQTVEHKISFGSPEWLEAVRHAASEADRLSLEMTIFSSAGWSETGGPWVKPEQAMKKLVWSETQVEGPRTFNGKLAQPPSSNGPIRNLSTSHPGAPPDPTYYADTVVLAYRTPSDEAAEPRPKITTSAAGDTAALADDNLNTALTLPGAGPAWIELEYGQLFKARAITIAARGGIPTGRVLASSDGSTFQTLVTLPGAQLYRGGQVRTFAFPETAARIFRIEITGAAMNPASVMNQTPPPPAKQYEITEAVLHSGARVHRWEEKAGFSFLFEYETTPTPDVPPAAAIPRRGVIDLTSKLTKDGVLNWDVPTGRWTILRMGYSLTGAKNRPAVPTGLGYEVDKLSRKHTEAYVHGYLDPIAASLGPLYGKALRYVLLDSWEAGMQNWTDDMLTEFRARRGYDPTPYLPALAGRVVESAETSDRFLWDFRRTLADMVADNHYGVIAGMLRSRGIGTYGEAAGVSLEIPEDTLLNKSKIDIPMGEFWVRDLHPFAMYYEDVRGAASAAHIYGKQIVAAESFTGGGYEPPYRLKKIGDYWFTQGVNRIVFHTSAHQPLDTKPGNTMVGTHIHRNITWADQAAPFMTYLARTSFMLQQGQSVADIAYLLNEGAPSTMPFWGAGLQPAKPDGYDYDYVNADVLLRSMSATSDGRLTLPNGASYRALVLPRTNRMTPQTARKIRELIAAGATVVGPKPAKSPSLSGQPEADAVVQAIAADVWGDLDGVSRTRRRYGKGTIAWGQPLEAVLGVPKDFESSHALDATVPWIHRRTPQADIYFVVNRSDRAQDIEARFRVSGKQAEIWHPDTGAMEPAEFTAAGDRTDVTLHLVERASVFVVFRRDAPSQPPPARRTTSTTLATIAGPWEVTFPSGRGAPAKAQFVKLESWTSNTDEGVKYFSGTATYSRAFDAPRAWFRTGAKLLLDLGAVRDLAEVSINGTALGVLWKPPYRLDATSVVRPGANLLEVRVTNQWINRLAGDRAVPAARRVLGAAPRFRFGPAPQPAESGLLGPVTVVMVEPRFSPPNPVVAGIPANYDEMLAGHYTLPEPLVLANGKRVRDAKTWFDKRRPEIVRLFEDNQFGRSPGRPAGMTFDVFDRGTSALDGKAVRKQVTVYFSRDRSGPKMDLLLYTPANARSPVPVLLNLSFTANSSAVGDPGITPGEIWGRDHKRVPAPRGTRFGHIDIKPLLDKGIGFAAIYYGDIDPDFEGGLPYGVRALYPKPGPDEWGAIAAWAWGLSRALDYLETDSAVDAKRVAILGVSRLGKTVLWAGAYDPRFAMVIASCSGEGGAALSRRNYGELVKHLNVRYGYQFCANYQKWGNDVAKMPMDSHMLLALIAPRPVLLQTGDRDFWSDPKGEFMAAVAADPVYRLLGKDGLGTDQMPAAGEPIQHTLGYYMHAGGHGMLPSDMDVFLRFMTEYLVRQHSRPATSGAPLGRGERR